MGRLRDVRPQADQRGRLVQRLGEEAGVTRALALAVGLALAGSGPGARAQDETAAPGVGDVLAARAAVQSVVVVGTSLLPGLQTPLAQVPSNVQVVDTDTASLRGAATLAGVLDRSLGAANVNDTAGNPYQLDLNFRGFTASPALGTPQGLSVFVDGVRVNEVFGDTVNWDLIPRGAIGRLVVMPGTNPVFGLNTLGGAISVTTRDGFDEEPGGEAALTLGAWGRRTLSLEGARHDAHWALFVSGETSRERGWALHDPSRVDQGFAKGGWRDGPDAASLALTLVDSHLEGSQTLPRSWLDTPRESYSWPDTQRNRLVGLTAHASHRLDADTLVEVTLHHRRVVSHGLNSNVADGFDTGLPPSASNPATVNLVDDVDQSRTGASVQLATAGRWLGVSHRVAVGATGEGGLTRFTQSSQPAGPSRDTASTAPVSLDTSLHARADSAGAFVTDTMALAPTVALTASGRYDVATVRLSDQIGTALNGHHVFRRFDPALGGTWNPTASFTAFASVAEGLRAPTPVELSCADPQAPCALPNAFASDPALKPVVSRTVEAGARGRVAESVHASAAVFETLLRDDLQFISSGGGTSSAGYFRNVGRTRRRGVELGLDARTGPWFAEAHYALVDATFRTPLVMNGAANSSAAPIACDTCTDIAVRPGNRLPGVPRQTLKLRLERTLGDAVSLGVRVVAQSGQYARGDENNADVNGKVPGFARVDLDAAWRIGRGWTASVQVDNAFGRRYSTFGVLGQNVFTAPGRTFDASGATWRFEQYRSSGAPRGAWLTVSWAFGGGDETVGGESSRP
jgi:outer membrane receptor protein involved in Fe transport